MVDDLLQVYVGSSRRDYVPMRDRIAVEGPKNTPTPVNHTGFVHVTLSCRDLYADYFFVFFLYFSGSRQSKRTMLATYVGKSKL